MYYIIRMIPYCLVFYTKDFFFITTHYAQTLYLVRFLLASLKNARSQVIRLLCDNTTNTDDLQSYVFFTFSGSGFSTGCF